MGIKATAGLIALLFLMFLMPASALSFTATVDTPLTVTVTPGATVQFILNHGVPVFVIADANGKATYLPLILNSA